MAIGGGDIRTGRSQLRRPTDRRCLQKKIGNVKYFTLLSHRTRHLSDALGFAKACVTWRTIMPRTDLLEQSATRVELDQRSREARLRLEHAERLLAVRPLARQPLLRRFLRYLGLRAYVGEKIAGRSPNATLTGGRAPQGRRMPGETGDAAASLCAASLVSRASHPRRVRIGSARSDPAIPSGAATVQDEFPIRFCGGLERARILELPRPLEQQLLSLS
jgi:hypothetical protein